MTVVPLTEAEPRPRRVAVGTFDGVHLGHREVIAGADTVLTFDPHPMGVVSPGHEPPLLTTLERKHELISSLGVAELVVIPFDASFAAQSPQAFIDEVLVGRLGATHVSVGENFRFGAKAKGDTALLEADARFETRVVPLLKPFGCRILVCDPYQELSAQDVADGVVMTDLDTLLAESDVVSLHARVTEETRGFLAAPQFARMKRGAYFVNTARGPMVNYPDLQRALESRHLRGAMLETFWQEPTPPDAPLLRLDNVTLTPHIAGASTTTVRIAARMAAEEVRRWLAGEPPLNPC